MSPFVYAIPVFVLLILVKVIVTVLRKKDYYNPNISTGVKWYVLIQFSLLMGVTTFFIGISHIIPYWSIACFTLMLAMNLIIVGWVLAKPEKIKAYEVWRFALSALTTLLAAEFWPMIPSNPGLFIIAWGGLSLVVVQTTSLSPDIL